MARGPARRKSFAGKDLRRFGKNWKKCGFGVDSLRPIFSYPVNNGKNHAQNYELGHITLQEKAPPPKG